MFFDILTESLKRSHSLPDYAIASSPDQAIALSPKHAIAIPNPYLNFYNKCIK
ncbi:hypothetical protein H6F74_28880 [Trichocoleus sp. FACHB-90]|uniref:hypothetical protein n=1 Tax=Cyanophyceae TaxID=3028117 RepID=UPI001681EAE8|nr:hypothetical protein [Trichocoleus sp. FACHB-90]MBD1930204.1 hypothetical protein [Trichocoleus sp. FACHB-90]